jgi:hypothetical protein
MNLEAATKVLEESNAVVKESKREMEGKIPEIKVQIKTLPGKIEDVGEEMAAKRAGDSPTVFEKNKKVSEASEIYFILLNVGICLCYAIFFLFLF